MKLFFGKNVSVTLSITQMNHIPILNNKWAGKVCDFSIWKSKSHAQSCLCNPMDWSPPDSSVHRDSPGKNTQVGCHCLLCCNTLHIFKFPLNTKLFFSLQCYHLQPLVTAPSACALSLSKIFLLTQIYFLSMKFYFTYPHSFISEPAIFTNVYKKNTLFFFKNRH